MAEGHVSARANDVLKTLSGAAADGLLAKNYLPEVLTSFDNAEAQVATDPMKLARLDIGLTLAAIHYARQISGGQFDPNRLSLYNDIHPEPVNPDAALKVLAFTPYPASYLESLAPKKEELQIETTVSEKTDARDPSTSPQ